MYILESCINSVLKPHEIKSKNETYSFVSLKELKNIINECAKIIAMHICHCISCKKTFNFTKIEQHKCSKISKLKYITPKKNSKKLLNQASLKNLFKNKKFKIPQSKQYV